MSEAAEIREQLRVQYPELSEEEIKILARYEQNNRCHKRFRQTEKYKQKQKERNQKAWAKTKELLSKIRTKENDNAN